MMSYKVIQMNENTWRIEDMGVRFFLLTGTDKALLIDCSEMEYISSAGLRFFMQLKRESEAKGGAIRITHLNEDVNDIFRMSGFQNLFTIE